MSTNENKNLSFLPIMLYGVFFVLVAILLLIRYEPFANDDVFIYFNYARNMANGNFFAYDVRNIPSEGFTSILYLLLLTPFEFFNINMMFASFVINLTAIIITCYLIYQLVKVSQLVSTQGALMVISLFTLAFISDRNTLDVLSWGLETFLGPLTVFSAALAIAYSYPPYSHKRAVPLFFVALFMAYLIRPENIAFIGGLGLPILWMQSANRRQIVISLVVFGVVFVVYHAIKYMIFGDIVPTGFYRKVGTGNDMGLIYVVWWIMERGFWFFVGLIWLAFVPQFRKIFKQPWVIFLVGISIISLLFFASTNPIVGEGDRRLISGTFWLYLMGALGAVLLIENRIKEFLKVYPLIFSVLIGGMFYGIINEGIENINIYQKSEISVTQHPYIRFGQSLHQFLSAPEEITLVFGDAGAIPYTLQGTFIDTNGLTEPAIAHLFQMPDSDEKITKYIDYILQYNPDIVVLGAGTPDENNILRTILNVHSPFDVPTPIEIYQGYYEHEIGYVCSLQFYYDLHIGLWQGSPHYNELHEILSTLCDTTGYFLEDGLTITDGEQSVFFPIHKD